MTQAIFFVRLVRIEQLQSGLPFSLLVDAIANIIDFYPILNLFLRAAILRDRFPPGRSIKITFASDILLFGNDSFVKLSTPSLMKLWDKLATFERMSHRINVRWITNALFLFLVLKFELHLLEFGKPLELILIEELLGQLFLFPILHFLFDSLFFFLAA